MAVRVADQKRVKGTVTTANIAATHPEYKKYTEKWAKCRACDQGEDAVKAAGDKYLPRLTKQSQEDYEAYKKRASFYAATSRTVSGLVGIMFRKDPEFDSTLSETAKEKFLPNAGGTQESFNNFAEVCAHNIVLTSRGGVLVDFPDEVDASAFPYWTHYPETCVCNWRVETVDGEPNVTTLVVLRETHDELLDDGFTHEEKTYYRVLELLRSKSDSDRFYVSQTLWEQVKDPVASGSSGTSGAAKKNVKFRLVKDEVYMNAIGRFISRIPFVFLGAKGNTSTISKPPVLDIANVNLSHYRNSADLEHGRHFTALPTPWAAGFKVDSGEGLYIGSQKAWVSESPNATCGFLEYTGQGLGALERALESKESQMAVLGARMLEEPKRAVESADTHKQRGMGEQSVTAALADALEESLQSLLDITHQMQPLATNSSVAPKVTLNKDFGAHDMSPEVLRILMDSVQQGLLSYPTLFHNLRKAELLPEGLTVEQELDFIKQYIPGLLQLMSGAPASEDEDEGNDEDESGNQ